GKDLNLVYPGGRTLLTKAIEDNEALSTVEAIIHAEANVDVQNMQGKTALVVAIRVRRPDVLRVLLESGSNQDFRSHNGFTDLTVEPDLVSSIKNSCNVNSTDETGTTPLMYAVKRHYDDCVRLLLLAVADVNRINKNKGNALSHLPCSEVPTLLLKI
ncbi:unnamed protein product, partial [Lymnaea stagnalis]